MKMPLNSTSKTSQKECTLSLLKNNCLNFRSSSLLFFLAFFQLALFGQSNHEEQQLIKKVIQTAYVEGLQNEGDTLKIDSGFHPNFKMIYKGEGMALKEYPLSQWRQRTHEAKTAGKLPRTDEKKVTIGFEFIDVTNDVAVAKVNYFEGGKKTYIDYISLYKFEEEWKIVTKLFYKVSN